MPNIILSGTNVKKAEELIHNLLHTTFLTEDQKKDIVITRPDPLTIQSKPIATIRVSRGTNLYLVQTIETICNQVKIAIGTSRILGFGNSPIITFYGIPFSPDCLLLRNMFNNPLKTPSPVSIRFVPSIVIDLSGADQPYAEVKPADADISPVSHNAATSTTKIITKHIQEKWNLDVERFHISDSVVTGSFVETQSFPHKKSLWMTFHPKVN